MDDCRAVLKFTSYEEFWRFCHGQCPDFREGCASDCELRKRLGIPPFGKSYLGKLKGEIQR